MINMLLRRGAVTPQRVGHQLATNSLRRCLTQVTGRSRRCCIRQNAVLEPAVQSPSFLSEEQVQKFHEDGFLVLNNFASKDEVNLLRARISELLKDFEPETISVFSTTNQSSDEYFFKSANNISFFFEEKAFNEEGHLRRPKELSINKVGHALHDLDPVFRAFSRSDKVKAVVKSLGYKKPVPVQSMYIFKQPFIGGEVVPHQDSTFIYTEPLSTVGLWWALEDATRTNGCLWGLPGVHKDGIARRMTVENGKLCFDRGHKAWDMTKFVPLEVEAGALVLLHGSNVHYSAENSSPISRHSYSMHVVEGTCKYADNNWLQRRLDLPFEPLYDDTADQA